MYGHFVSVSVCWNLFSECGLGEDQHHTYRHKAEFLLDIIPASG